MTNTGIARIANLFLNTVDDPVPGQTVTGGQSYAGQVGAYLVLNQEDAAKLSSTSGIALKAGVYQYVQFRSGSTAANVAGGPVYWYDRDNFIVTPDVPATYLGFAGVSLNVVTKGNYGFILVEGVVYCHALANTTKSSPAAGDNLILTSTAGAFDDLADATAFDGTNLKLVAGQWIEAPVDASGGGVYLAFVKNACKVGVV